MPFFLNLSAICGAKQEVTVTNVDDTIKRRFRFGMNCANCDNELIAPEWSEYRNERQVHHVWHCWKCDSCFETIVETKVTEDAMQATKFSRREWWIGQFRGSSAKPLPHISRHAARLDFRGFACLLASANC